MNLRKDIVRDEYRDKMECDNLKFDSLSIVTQQPGHRFAKKLRVVRNNKARLEALVYTRASVALG
jgi:hypothetical protein